MATTSRRNQQHPPLPKKKRVDALGNDHRRLFVKSGTATLLLAKMPSNNAADAAVDHITNMIEKLGGQIQCSFLSTR